MVRAEVSERERECRDIKIVPDKQSQLTRQGDGERKGRIQRYVV